VFKANPDFGNFSQNYGISINLLYYKLINNKMSSTSIYKVLLVNIFWFLPLRSQLFLLSGA